MPKVKKYVLTGGPGSGKSSIVIALEMRGEYVIREAAEDYIRLRQAQGQPEPWTEENFQDKILELQILRESRIPKNIERIFIDRGIIDGMAYFHKAGKRPSKKLLDEANKAYGRAYDKIFLIENLGSCESNHVRRENIEEALILERLQERNYRYYEFPVIKVPASPLDDRVNYILERV